MPGPAEASVEGVCAWGRLKRVILHSIDAGPAPLPCGPTDPETHKPDGFRALARFSPVDAAAEPPDHALADLKASSAAGGNFPTRYRGRIG
jgi:hypothetical protein